MQIQRVAARAVFSSLLLGVGFGTVQAQTAAPRAVTCASTSVFNTGSDGAGGKLAVNGIADPSWGYADATGMGTAYPPAGTTWTTPVTGRLNTAAWAWTDSDTVSPQAQWITREPLLSGAINNYYRYVFNLDSAVDAALFQVATTYYADDGVLAIYVNGQAQSPVPGNGWTPSPPTPRVTTPQTITLGSDWVTGTNEVVLVVRNASNGNPSGMLVNTSIANCATVIAPAPVPTLEWWSLAALAALLTAGTWVGRKTLRRG